jgi:hypothetical protein
MPVAESPEDGTAGFSAPLEPPPESRNIRVNSPGSEETSLDPENPLAADSPPLPAAGWESIQRFRSSNSGVASLTTNGEPS